MPDILFTPSKLGPIQLRNRSIRSAANEGMAPGHLVSDDLIDYHRSVSTGGVGMTTVAYASVSKSGLSFPHQLLMNTEAIPGLRQLTDAVHSEGAMAAIQIGHCGLMSKRSLAGDCMAPSSKFNLYGPTWPRKMKQEDIDQVVRDFGRATRLAREAGFDAVEVHAGHGYLISQFLSPFTNKRKDNYGGTLENRSRFMKEVVEEVLNAASEHMRGKMPVDVMAKHVKEKWMKPFIRYFGNSLMKPFPFTEGYFLDDAMKVREAVKLPIIYVGGMVSKQKIEEVLDKGFEFVQIARALIHDPAFINKLKSGEIDRSECKHSNYCIAVMYSGQMKCFQHEKDLSDKLRNKLSAD
jgi:2,4-dienoyl-CoA reductase-like NADH-dependent reductase (Old Yellow Enzyme family)